MKPLHAVASILHNIVSAQPQASAPSGDANSQPIVEDYIVVSPSAQGEQLQAIRTQFTELTHVVKSAGGEHSPSSANVNGEEDPTQPGLPKSHLPPASHNTPSGASDRTTAKNDNGKIPHDLTVGKHAASLAVNADLSTDEVKEKSEREKQQASAEASRALPVVHYPGMPFICSAMFHVDPNPPRKDEELRDKKAECEKPVAQRPAPSNKKPRVVACENSRALPVVHYPGMPFICSAMFHADPQPYWEEEASQDEVEKALEKENVLANIEPPQGGKQIFSHGRSALPASPRILAY